MTVKVSVQENKFVSRCTQSALYKGMQRSLVPAALLLLASAASAAAKEGEARWSGWLRAGPGMQYAVLDEIPAKSKIDVQSCTNGWCAVTSGAAKGYVSADLVNIPPAPQPPAHIIGCFTTQETGYGPQGGEAERFCGK